MPTSRTKLLKHLDAADRRQERQAKREARRRLNAERRARRRQLLAPAGPR
jgi:hypothetical protein